MSGYALRPAVENDREFLLRVYASTREEELAMVPWTDDEKAAFVRSQFTLQDVHYRKHYEGAALDVILVDGEPAGRLYVYRSPSEIRVMDIALLPAFRRRGIGERVFRDLFAEADARGQLVSIHVEVQNVARRLYERLGFHAVPTDDEHPAYILMERQAKIA